MDPRLLSDEQLVLALLPEHTPNPAHRNAAWNELADRVHGELMSYIGSRAGKASVEDVYQDTFLTAFSGVEEGRYTPVPGKPFVAYLKGVAWNVLLTTWRGMNRCDELEDPDTLPGKADRVHSVEHGLIKSEGEDEERQMLRDGIGHLTEMQRAVVELYLKGLDYPAIAERLGLAETAVRQHKSRAVKALRRRSGKE